MPIATKRTKAPPVQPRPKTHRPARYDEQGKHLPTALEIEEGKAWKDKTLRFDNYAVRQEWESLHWRLWREQGQAGVCTTRCEACGVLRFGREWRDACGYCHHQPDRDSEEAK